MHAREHELHDLIERALERELAARRSLRPHAQLAIPANASRAMIEQAYGRLRARYDATAFADYGPTAVAAAERIAELLRAAYEAMSAGDAAALRELQPAPRRDETCRALQALRGAIERRMSDALAHRQAGRPHEALRVYESVLVLDRQNKVAHEAVQELRAALAPKRPGALSRVFGRLFG